MKKYIETAKDVVEINVIKSPNSPVTIISKCNRCEKCDIDKECEIDWL